MGTIDRRRPGLSVHDLRRQLRECDAERYQLRTALAEIAPGVASHPQGRRQTAVVTAAATLFLVGATGGALIWSECGTQTELFRPAVQPVPISGASLPTRALSLPFQGRLVDRQLTRARMPSSKSVGSGSVALPASTHRVVSLRSARQAETHPPQTVSRAQPVAAPHHRPRPLSPGEFGRAVTVDQQMKRSGDSGNRRL